MSEKQLVAAVKLVRNMCLGKTKTTPGKLLYFVIYFVILFAATA